MRVHCIIIIALIMHIKQMRIVRKKDICNKETTSNGEKIASQTGASLEEKNLLPLVGVGVGGGANYFLQE